MLDDHLEAEYWRLFSLSTADGTFLYARSRLFGHERRRTRMTTQRDADENPLATYFEQTHITISDRGDPPMADAEDPLLDRDRIHLDEDEGDRGDE